MSFPATKILCLGIGITLLLGCTEKQPETENVIRPVRFQEVTHQTSNPDLTFTGIVKADIETDFSFKVTGTLVSLNVTLGKRIKKGDLIAALDDSDAKLKYDKQLLALQKSETQKDTAQSNLTRTKGLYENNTVPLSEYESAKEKYSNANASFETEKRAVDLIKRELGYYKLYSPVDGVVLLSDLSINENIQPGQVISVIQSGNTLVVEVGIPEQYVSRTKINQSATINFSSIPNKVFKGNVTEVAYTANTDTSTYPVTVEIINPVNTMRPGMPANVALNFSSGIKLDSVLIPTHSVSKDSSGNFVLLLMVSNDGFGIVRKQPVTVGDISNKGYEITSGLNIGDKVITAGISSLVDGMKVRLLK
ncbi:MAG: efflux RND transporter periplasmic adaptor subunit [Ectothiorhodospiraceae bacterium]|nr:efflux RND transporter periplasmic adaptor subunit [Ectothiorhodospiraceae bacterium]